MKSQARSRTAAAVAFVLLVCAAIPALAHKQHEQAARESSREQPILEETAAAPAATAKATHDHDHAGPGVAATRQAAGAEAGEPAESNVPRALAWLGKFHPPLTHFPIALLTAAALAEFLYIRTHDVALRHAVLFCVRLGAAAAILAAILGWFFAGFHLVDEEWVMTAHRWLGTATALFAATLAYLLGRMESPAGPIPGSATRFRAALFSTAALVGGAGFLGGALVYGLDHYAW